MLRCFPKHGQHCALVAFASVHLHVPVAPLIVPIPTLTLTPVRAVAKVVAAACWRSSATRPTACTMMLTQHSASATHTCQSLYRR